MAEYGGGNARRVRRRRAPASPRAGRCRAGGSSGARLRRPDQIINERIAARGGRRPYQVLEPGLAPRFGAQWAEITGSATGADRQAVAEALAAQGQQDRYEERVRLRDGSSVPSGAGVQRKLDEARAIIDGDLPGDLRARMQAGTPDAARQAEKRQALAEDPLPAAEQAQLWKLISQPGGISGREAARQLQRAQPAGAPR